jgi:hypothetical protein
VELVRRGDILLFHGWYNAAANEIIKEIYERNHHPKWHSPRNAKVEGPKNVSREDSNIPARNIPALCLPPEN